MLLAVLHLAAEATNDVPAAPVLIVMALGVLIAIGGHLYGSKTVVAMGLFMLFLATAAMVVGGYLAYTGGEEDIRDDNNPREPGF